MNRAERNLPVPLALEQQPLLIQHQLDGGVVPQRPQDGYINATRLCEQAGKWFGNYRRNAQTQAFLQALSIDMRISISNLVQVIQGRGDKVEQGTWVHPQVAIHLGQWLSPEFSVQVTKWVFDWMRGVTTPFMPQYVRRFLKNRAKIPHTHFSMLNEIYLSLVAPLEESAIILPDKMMPDISTGRMFSDFLRTQGIDPTDFRTYDHEFVDGTRPVVKARLYPLIYLPDFRGYFHGVWLPSKAEGYFSARYPKALPFLPRIQQLPSPTGSMERRLTDRADDWPPDIPF